jgi:glutathione S-transferase
MITLYSFGSAFGLPDPSPFVTKVAVLLKMAGLTYRTDTTGFAKAPKKKLPYINDDGSIIADSTFIRQHLEAKYRFDFDRGLSPQQKAIAWAFEKMAEDNLYWTLVHARWADDREFNKGPRNFFNAAPAVIRPMIIAMVRRQVRRDLYGQGLGRHSRDEVGSIGTRAIDAIAVQLGQNTCFLGTEPTGVDATIFPMIMGVLCPHFDSPLRTAAERHANLRDYTSRMTARYFPDLLAAPAAAE